MKPTESFSLLSSERHQDVFFFILFRLRLGVGPKLPKAPVRGGSFLGAGVRGGGANIYHFLRRRLLANEQRVCGVCDVSSGSATWAADAERITERSRRVRRTQNASIAVHAGPLTGGQYSSRPISSSAEIRTFDSGRYTLAAFTDLAQGPCSRLSPVNTDVVFGNFFYFSSNVYGP